jgi:hypothetical protein
MENIAAEIAKFVEEKGDILKYFAVKLPMIMKEDNPRTHDIVAALIWFHQVMDTTEKILIGLEKQTDSPYEHIFMKMVGPTMLLWQALATISMKEKKYYATKKDTTVDDAVKSIAFVELSNETAKISLTAMKLLKDAFKSIHPELVEMNKKEKFTKEEVELIHVIGEMQETVDDITLLDGDGDDDSDGDEKPEETKPVTV